MLKAIVRGLVAACLWIGGCSTPQAARPAGSAPPGGAPEEVLRQIEESLAAAKTVRIRCSCEQIVRASSGREERFRLEGKTLLKEGRKVLVTFLGTDPQGDRRGVSFSSDGSRVTFRVGFALPPQECASPKVLREAVVGPMGRLGVAFTSLLVANRLQADGDRMEAVASPRVADFSKAEEDATSACFVYRVTDPGGRVMAAKLWYEKGTLRPLKRIVSREEGDQSLSFVETYQDYVLDGPLPDAEFDPPARRAPEDKTSSHPRRMVTDRAGWTLVIEKEREEIAFILLASAGALVTEDGAGLHLKRGGTTIALGGTHGLLLSGKGGFSAIAIPEGWERDLVEDYRQRASAASELTIRQWLLDELRARPAAPLEQFAQKE